MRSRACARVCARVSWSVCVRVRAQRVSKNGARVRAPSHPTAETCGIISSAHAGASAAAWLRFGATGRARARCSAGVNWTRRTASAPWAVRAGHTSVIDAAGAIYVIGGGHDSDVWASTDGGARPDSV